MGKNIIYLLLTIFASYLCGIWLDYENRLLEKNLKDKNGGNKKNIKKASKCKKRWGISFVIIFILGILVSLKYYNFIGENISFVCTFFAESILLLQKLIVPLGLSFYTLQSIGYIFDLYRRKIVAERMESGEICIISFLLSTNNSGTFQSI